MRVFKSFQSDPNAMTEIEEFLLKYVDTLGLNEDQINFLTLSVAEASSNCIVHGNKSDSTKKVELSIEIDENNIKIILKDEGKGFDINNVPDPTTAENILKDHGRGIHIMKTFLTELKYNFTDSGTETILVFKYK